MRLVAAVLVAGVIGFVAPLANAGRSWASGSFSADAAVPFRAVLTLSPITSALGQTITASEAKTTVPRGDTLTRIRISWGDGSAAVKVARLGAHPTHRYPHAGRFVARLTITDKHGNVGRSSAVEHVYATAGSYSGPSGLHFYVSFSGTTVQDVSLAPWLSCTNNSGMYDDLSVPSAAIATDGSFSAARMSTGVLNGQRVSYRYEFSGKFRWSNSVGQTQAAGRMRETITFHGSTVTCTTGTQPWTGGRDVQPLQRKAAPLAGSYAGSSGLHFYVSFSRKTVQDVSGSPWLYCSNGSGMYDGLTIASAAITSGGAFDVNPPPTTGILNGQSVTYRYSFRGNFHGIGQTGFERAAGTLRETITFAGSSVTCTTNDVPWTAQRDVQPTQTGGAPHNGGYQGSPAALTFSVASATQLTNVSASPWLNCSNGSGMYGDLSIGSATINSADAFARTETDTTVISGHPAAVTYTFSGNFHGVGQSGVERAAGTMRETVEFTGSSVTCTTNTTAWSAQQST